MTTITTTTTLCTIMPTGSSFPVTSRGFSNSVIDTDTTTPPRASWKTSKRDRGTTSKDCNPGNNFCYGGDEAHGNANETAATTDPPPILLPTIADSAGAWQQQQQRLSNPRPYETKPSMKPNGEPKNLPKASFFVETTSMLPVPMPGCRASCTVSETETEWHPPRRKEAPRWDRHLWPDHHPRATSRHRNTRFCLWPEALPATMVWNSLPTKARDDPWTTKAPPVAVPTKTTKARRRW
mmetsp:Transcript_111051/g.227287  ORF Transcript_111051/g.227287 Transcript_111051/m.227287 type:complete len:238 (+) Transcript_111051:231-944(+)